MRVQVVVENSTEHRGLGGEHGLAQLVETPRGTLLFDTGQGRMLERNMDVLGISGKDLEGIVCSHGHYDHTWGIPHILRRGWAPPIYGHEACGTPRYALRQGGPVPIGFSLANLGNLFRPLQGGEELLPGVFAFVAPRERREKAFVPVTPSLVVPGKDGEWEPDPFDDDLSLLVRGRFGWSVLLGCAHSGVVNMLEEAARLAGTREFYAVQGGMHLKGQSFDFVQGVLGALKERFQVQQWRPNHCTGMDVALAMGGVFPGKVCWAGGGSSAEL